MLCNFFVDESWCTPYIQEEKIRQKVCREHHVTTQPIDPHPLNWELTRPFPMISLFELVELTIEEKKQYSKGLDLQTEKLTS